MARTLRRWWIALVAAALVVGAGITVPVMRAAADTCGGGEDVDTCSMAFSGQPANALLNSNITTQGFNASGAPVSVQLSENDGDGDAIGNVTVTLTLVQSGSGATLSGPTSGVTNSAGVVTFGSTTSPLTVNQTGYYQLQANAAGFSPVNSSVFQILGSVNTCTTTPCSDSITGTTSGSAVVVNGVGDLLSMGLGGLQYSCPGYTPLSGIVSTDVWQSDGNTISTSSAQTKVIIPDSVVDGSHRKASAFQVCYASTTTFTPLGGGSPATITVTVGGSTVTFYVGLLPNCATGSPVPPCVLSRHVNGRAVITFLGTGDFYGQM